MLLSLIRYYSDLQYTCSDVIYRNISKNLFWVHYDMHNFLIVKLKDAILLEIKMKSGVGFKMKFYYQDGSNN